MNSDKTNAELARLWSLETSANQLVLEGKRNPRSYLDFLQGFVWGNVLPDINWQLTYRKLNREREYEVAIRALAVLQGNPQLWVLPMIRGITSNLVIAAFRHDGVPTWIYREDMDTGMKHDRDAIGGSYLIGFRRTVEADEENRGKSANVLALENHKGITLPERLVLGYGYYVTTGGQHLDVNCITLCTGSRNSGGHVPYVGFDGGRVCVGCYGLGNADGDLRSRSAVSVTAEQTKSA